VTSLRATRTRLSTVKS